MNNFINYSDLCDLSDDQIIDYIGRKPNINWYGFDKNQTPLFILLFLDNKIEVCQDMLYKGYSMNIFNYRILSYIVHNNFSYSIISKFINSFSTSPKRLMNILTNKYLITCDTSDESEKTYIGETIDNMLLEFPDDYTVDYFPLTNMNREAFCFFYKRFNMKKDITSIFMNFLGANDLETVLFIIENFKEQLTQSRVPPLMMASHNCEIFVKLLELKCFDINCVDDHKSTLLHYLSQCGYVEQIKAVLKCY